MPELHTMSDKEISRFEVLQQVIDRRMTQQQAGQILKLSWRQVHRLVKAVKQHGAAGLISKRRGKPGNRQLAQGVTIQAVTLIKERYADFGPTLACEKLRELHEINLSVETVRKLMTNVGLWTPRALRNRVVHQPRARRRNLGELIQIDGCEHAWFEDRGPKCTLLVYVDDATSKIMAGRLVDSESTISYMATTRDYIIRHGKPLAIYSDRHSVFNVNQKEILNGEGITQFCRALQQLGIELICAKSPQAKGRVERAHLTLQDRLVKELRLQGINSIESGNAFLETFIEDYNRRFGKVPQYPFDSHRPLGERDNLEDIFSIQEKRKLSKNLTFRYHNTDYAIEPCFENLKLKNKRVTILTKCDGSMQIRYGKSELKVVKDQIRVSRSTPPLRAGHKDLTAIMNRLIPDEGLFIDLSVESPAWSLGQ